MRGDLFMKCEVMAKRFRDCKADSRVKCSCRSPEGSSVVGRLWGKGVQISEQNQPDF